MRALNGIFQAGFHFVNIAFEDYLIIYGEHPQTIK